MPARAALSPSAKAASANSAGVAIATMRAPVAVRKARRLSWFSSGSSMTASSHLLGGALNRFDGRVMGPTAANQIAEGVPDFLLGGVRIARQEFGPRHDPTIDAIAALVDLFLDPRGLQRMGLFWRAEAREGRNVAL